MKTDPSEEDDRKYESGAPAKNPADDDAFQKGNTLDYYNEDLSRKAVGRLFSDGGGDGLDEDFVKGFTDSKRPAKPEHVAERSDTAEASAGNPYEDDDARERRRDKYDKSDRDEKNPGGSGKKPDRPGLKPTPQPSPAVRAGHKPGASAGRPPQNPGRTMPGDSAYPPAKRRPGFDDDPKGSSGEDYSQFKRKYDERDYVTGPRKRTAPPRPAAGAGRPYADDAYDEPENAGLLKIVFGGVVLVFLVVLAILCFNLNRVNSRLQDAQNKLENMQNQGDYNSIKILNEQLTQENTELKNKVEELNARLDDAGLGGVQQSAPPSASDAPGAQRPPDDVNAAPEWPKTYTVVSGDSLSRIARNFYGSASQANVDKIKNYNNLTSDNINIGDKLKIPE